MHPVILEDTWWENPISTWCTPKSRCQTQKGETLLSGFLFWPCSAKVFFFGTKPLRLLWLQRMWGLHVLIPSNASQLYQRVLYWSHPALTQSTKWSAPIQFLSKPLQACYKSAGNCLVDLYLDKCLRLSHQNVLFQPQVLAMNSFFTDSSQRSCSSSLVSHCVATKQGGSCASSNENTAQTAFGTQKKLHMFEGTSCSAWDWSCNICGKTDTFAHQNN